MPNLKTRISDTSLTFWAWLFPITSLMHIAEEYWFGGGYSEYLLRLRGVHLSNTRFLVAQGIGLVLLVLGIFIAQRLKFLRIMLVILGSVVLANALSHIVTSASQLSYGPGLTTSILVWLPLGIATLVRFYGAVAAKKYWVAVGIGISINIVIAIFTMRGGRIV